MLLSTLDSGVGVAAGFLVEAQEGVVMGVLVGSTVPEVTAGPLVEAQEGIVTGASVDSRIREVATGSSVHTREGVITGVLLSQVVTLQLSHKGCQSWVFYHVLWNHEWEEFIWVCH